MPVRHGAFIFLLLFGIPFAFRENRTLLAETVRERIQTRPPKRTPVGKQQQEMATIKEATASPSNERPREAWIEGWRQAKRLEGGEGRAWGGKEGDSWRTAEASGNQKQSTANSGSIINKQLQAAASTIQKQQVAARSKQPRGVNSSSNTPSAPAIRLNHSGLPRAYQNSAATRNLGSGDVVDVLVDHADSSLRLRKGKQPGGGALLWSRFDAGLCTPFTNVLVATILRAERCIEDSTFVSPIGNNKTRGKIAEWGKYAAEKRVQAPGALKAAYWALEQWYEALRILAFSFEENEEGAIMFLKMMFSASRSVDTDHNYHEQPPASTQAKGVPGLRRLELAFLKRHDVPAIYTHFVRLKQAMLEKAQSYGDAFRGIVFVQKRVMVHILTHFLRQDPETAEKFECVELYSTAHPATPSLGITERAAKDALAAFAAGRANLLVSAGTPGEDMNVPAANCLFRYDPVNVDPLRYRYFESGGSTHQNDSGFVITQAHTDRRAAQLPDVKLRQVETATQVAEPQGKTENAKACHEAEARELEARAILAKYFEGESTDNNRSVYTLNLYVSKTKAELKELFLYLSNVELLECQLTYCSYLRTVTASGMAQDKKSAKRMAAHDLLYKLFFGLVVGV